jgi:hypothetical protein
MVREPRQQKPVFALDGLLCYVIVTVAPALRQTIASGWVRAARLPLWNRHDNYTTADGKKQRRIVAAAAKNLEPAAIMEQYSL